MLQKSKLFAGFKNGRKPILLVHLRKKHQLPKVEKQENYHHLSLNHLLLHRLLTPKVQKNSLKQRKVLKNNSNNNSKCNSNKCNNKCSSNTNKFNHLSKVL